MPESLRQMEQGGAAGGKMQALVAFLLAGRDLLEAEEECFQSDIRAFQLRVSMLIVYGMLQLFVLLTGILYFGVIDRSGDQWVCAGHAIGVALLFVGVHLANRFRWMKMPQTIGICVAFLLLVNFSCPLLVQVTQCIDGWHWSFGVFLAMIGGPVGAVVLTDRPASLGSLLVVSMVLFMMAIMIYFAQAAPAHTKDGEPYGEAPLLFNLFSLMVPYGLIPCCLAVMFRWECRQHRKQCQAQADQHNNLMTFRATTQWLLFSMIPPGKVSELPRVAPECWYTSACDEYSCTVLQMDVSGFTELSSRIESSELVALIQALFTSVDYAAECIGNVWKVELIGDCYKAMIGGPYACEDHQVRGAALAYSIVEICSSIAKRLQVPLSVRVGVHTGHVTAAVVETPTVETDSGRAGVKMPRYLTFGRDCEIVSRLESAADPNSVFLSYSTIEALDSWPHSLNRSITLLDGSRIQGHCSGEGDLSRIKGRFPDLDTFLRDIQKGETLPRQHPAGRVPVGSAVPVNVQRSSSAAQEAAQRRAAQPESEIRDAAQGAAGDGVAASYRRASRVSCRRASGAIETWDDASDLSVAIQDFATSTKSLPFRRKTRSMVAELRSTAVMDSDLARWARTQSRSSSRSKSRPRSQNGEAQVEGWDSRSVPSKRTPSTMSGSESAHKRGQAAGGGWRTTARAFKHSMSTSSPTLRDSGASPHSLFSVTARSSSFGSTGYQRQNSKSSSKSQTNTAPTEIGLCEPAIKVDVKAELGSVQSKVAIKLPDPPQAEREVRAVLTEPQGSQTGAQCREGKGKEEEDRRANASERNEHEGAGRPTAAERRGRDQGAGLQGLTGEESKESRGGSREVLRFADVEVRLSSQPSNGEHVRRSKQSSSGEGESRSPWANAAGGGLLPRGTRGEGGDARLSGLAAGGSGEGRGESGEVAVRMQGAGVLFTPSPEGSSQEGSHMNAAVDVEAWAASASSHNPDKADKAPVASRMMVQEEDNPPNPRAVSLAQDLPHAPLWKQDSFNVRRIVEDPEEDDDDGMSSVLMDMVQHGGGTGPATPLQFQKTISWIFVLACTVTAVLQVTLMLALSLSESVEGLQWESTAEDNAILLPCVLLLMLLLALAAHRLDALEWSSGRPQALTSVVLMCAALALEGVAKDRHLTRWTALLWGFLAVLVQCSCTRLESRVWMLWMLAYLGMGVGLGAWVTREQYVFEGVREVEWWREILMGWNCIVVTTLFVLPLGLSARAVVRLQSRARTLLVSTKKHLMLENELLDALVPPAVTSRLLRGDHLVTDDIAEGTAMFAYIHEYEAMVLKHGAPACIQWINAVFRRLDEMLADEKSMTKVETFNNFWLLFCTAPQTHVQESLSLAVRMLHEIEDVVRPDGKPTMLKIGVSSGPFTTGLIGLQSPRYSIFGDTVNTASRMASSAAPCTAACPFIHLSPSSRTLLGKGGEEELLRALGAAEMVLGEHGMTDIKGKGRMRTFSLRSLPRPAPARAILPGPPMPAG